MEHDEQKIYYSPDREKVKCENCGYLRAEKVAATETDEYSILCPRCGYMWDFYICNRDRRDIDGEAWRPVYRDCVHPACSALFYKLEGESQWHDGSCLDQKNLEEHLQFASEEASEMDWHSHTIEKDGEWYLVDGKTGEETLITDDAPCVDTRRGYLAPVQDRERIEKAGPYVLTTAHGAEVHFRLKADISDRKDCHRSGEHGDIPVQALDA